MKEQLKEQVKKAEDEIASFAEEISDVIFKNPELSDKEYFSSKYLASLMEKMGFAVTYPYLGIETAFRCVYGDDDGPKVGFLAEYDALPGFGKAGDEAAHACGHNWIAASTVAASLALQKLKNEVEYKGQIVLIGTPGEELYGRKVNMAQMGAFDDLDAVFQMHLDAVSSVDTKTLAITDFLFEFFGRASHASQNPELGINALDACNLTFAGINALRQQLPSETRIHAIYKDGGQSPNIIPAHASMHIFVRAGNVERLESVVERVLNIGRGAELMTGATFKYTRAENTYYDLKRNAKLDAYMKANLEDLGITKLVPGDLYHAVSSDIGNVSYCCPTCYCTMGTAHLTDAKIHEKEFLKIVNSQGAYQLLHIAAKAMAMSAIDVYLEKK